MAHPEQIRKQTEAIENYYRQQSETSEPQASEEVDELDSSETDAEVTEESAESQTEEAQEATTDSEDDEKWAQRYRSLQGMYNAEVPRLHAQNKEMTQKIQQMEQLLATMSSTGNTKQPEAQTTASYVTDQDRDDYGDSIDVMRRVSKEELTPVMQKLSQLEQLVSQLQTNVVPQVQQVAQRQAATADQMFWADLAREVPNWRDVNENQEFQSWLLELDPMTGQSRQTYLADAQRNYDAKRVAAFFKTWMSQTGTSTPQPKPATSELQKQVAPGKSKNAGAAVSADKPTYTPDQIKKFFDDVRKGKYRGRDSERAKIERDIFAAQNDGRIQFN